MVPGGGMSYLESIGDLRERIRTGRNKARPLTYHGIKFRSTLEVRFAWHLDLIGEKWVYEPRVFGPRGRGYLPDFQILGAVRPTFIEVKPRFKDIEPAKRKMSVIWETHPDALLMVACKDGRLFTAAYRDSEWETWQERWVA
jgi:hypothetical protein